MIVNIGRSISTTTEGYLSRLFIHWGILLLRCLIIPAFGLTKYSLSTICLFLDTYSSLMCLCILSIYIYNLVLLLINKNINQLINKYKLTLNTNKSIGKMTK